MSLAAIFAPFWLSTGTWGSQTVNVNVSLGQTPSSVSGVGNTSLGSGQLAIATNNPDYLQGTPVIPTGSRTLIATGNVSPLRYAYIKNCDDFNYCSVFSDSSGSSELMRLFPGDCGAFPLAPSATLYCEANTASVMLQVYFVAG